MPLKVNPAADLYRNFNRLLMFYNVSSLGKQLYRGIIKGKAFLLFEWFVKKAIATRGIDKLIFTRVRVMN